MKKKQKNKETKKDSKKAKEMVTTKNQITKPRSCHQIPKIISQ